jgi:glutamine amidotransferase-like uncharacterized protein
VPLSDVDRLQKRPYLIVSVLSGRGLVVFSGLKKKNYKKNKTKQTNKNTKTKTQNFPGFVD